MNSSVFFISTSMFTGLAIATLDKHPIIPILLWVLSIVHAVGLLIAINIESKSRKKRK